MNTIDILFYINLRHRQDRDAHLRNQLSQTSLDPSKIHRIEAVYDANFGALGCARSHCAAIERFCGSEASNRYGLILEDDFMFTESQEIVHDLLTRVFTEDRVHFDVLMIASNTYRESPTPYTYLTRIQEAQTASGYIVNRDYAPILLQNFKESVALLGSAGHAVHEFCLDQHWKRLQPNSRWYCLRPKIGKQCVSFSDIEKILVNYGC